MRRRATSILPSFLALTLTATVLPATLAHAQSKISADQKDQEIQLLKAEVKQLEQRVENLEGLSQKVKVIDSKIEVQEQTQRKKALEMPIVKTGNEGFILSSPTSQPGDQPNYKIKLAANVQGNGRFFTSGADKNVSSTFYLNKFRPILSRTVGNYYDFLIMP